MIELDETPVPPAESVPSLENAPEQAAAQESTRSTLGFLADEERSGFGADEESFGFLMRSTAKAVVETETTLPLGADISADASAPDISISSNDALPRPQFSFDDTADNATPDDAFVEAVVPKDSLRQDNIGQHLAGIFVSESAKSGETNLQEASLQEKLPTTVEPAPEKPLSEAQQLADMLANAAVGTVNTQTTSTEAAFTDSIADSTAESNDSTPKVITIPSEAELAKEQQRQLRKQELLDYQHRKKEQFKAAEQAERRSLGRTIAAIVMTTLVGAATTASFFAWRNPALRTATEEAWQKLTGKTGTQANTVQMAGSADSMLSVANTASGSGTSQTAGNTVTPLDLTQSASGANNSNTVAVQGTVSDSARPSTNTTTPNVDSVKRQHLIAQTSAAQTASTPSLSANKEKVVTESKKTAEKPLPPPTTGLLPESKANAGKGATKDVTKGDAKQKIAPTQQQLLADAKPLKTSSQQGSVATAKNDSEAKSTQKKPTLSKPSSVEKLSAPYLNNGVFAIQVYASPSQADAEDWIERLRRRGFLNPSMSSQIVRGQVVYRVRFGLYNNLRDAERDAERYGFAGAWVVRLR